MTSIVLQVAMKALIVDERGRVLILREAPTYGQGTQAGRYEVPGGRVEPGEPFDAALKREVREETGLEVTIGNPVLVGEWRPVIKGVPHQIIGMYLICKPQKSAKVALGSEHDDCLWISPADYQRYDILPPDDQAIARLASLA